MSSSSLQTEIQVTQCALCGSFCPSMKKMYVRLVHQEDPNFFITCSARGCTKTFRSFPAFNTHKIESGEVSALDLSSVSEDIVNESNSE